MKPRSFLLRLLAALTVAIASGRSADAQITLADTPLFLSTSVTPNVMLLFDNSGSMDNMMWTDGFDPGVAYTDWSRSCNSGNSCWSASDGNVFLSEVPRGNCPSGYKQGRRSNGSTRCLRLPDPVGSGNTRYSGAYLNYLFDTFGQNCPNSGSCSAKSVNLTSGVIPLETRLMTAKNVSTTLVSDNAELRWGLARFNQPAGNNGAPGGRVVQNCGAPIASVNSGINGLNADSNTPLAETFYEITRYFRGLSSYYNNGVSYTSPIQYRCQRNFVVVVTDGFPTYDNTFPNDDPDDAADTLRALPNWDNLAPATTQSTYPLFPSYSDGFKPSGAESDEAYTLFLDDMAKFGYDTDLRKSGNDLTGVSFNDSSFRIQRLQTFTVGLALNNQMLRDAAEYGGGKAYTANTSAQLRDALQRAIKEIAAVTSAAASIATNSTRLTADTAIYQARFRTSDWSGQLLSLPIRADGQVGDPLWDAAQQMPSASDRVITTYDPTAPNPGKRFQWNQLNAAQKDALNRNTAGTADGNGEARLNYLRGDRSNEGAGLNFRVRSAILGDIVNSDPAYVGQQDYGFDKLPAAAAEGASYAAFRSSAAYRGRPSMIYVGANDGMLHGFRTTDGRELLAHVPSPVYGRLSALTDPAYNGNHKYLVDGSIKTLDAYVRGAWKTILVGALGGGGRGVFALDVTDPATFGTGSVMWEFTSAQDADMGYSYAQPTIARLKDGHWVAIIANGYNSSSGRAVLFLLDLTDGSVIKKFDTGVGGNNGLSSPIPVDIDGDRITDLIYAGDLRGNMWKFDLRSASSADWRIGFGTAAAPEPLFTACSADPCTNANRQPITARPEVGFNKAEVTGYGGVVVYFGTGRYFAVGDNSSGAQTNTFYGIYDIDDGAVTSGVNGRNALLRQEVISTSTLNFPNGITEDVRVTSANRSSGERGWYLDLPLSGERQVSTPILRNGSIIFTTLIPNTAACAFGGDSYLMEVNALTGSRLDETPFDLNRDRAFNSDDYAGGLPVSGRRSVAGIIKTPAIISAATFEIKLASGTTGGIDTTYEPPASPTEGGRLSWRQIR
ncbi:PilC/PilY family type IV pilus protein [Fontimonas sp. SYSU GA230001]|uniref:pilus assembly protein n=1 Tax=Fontimonas sp. SYSU GA230001 TaxID=3142450 RepID=UPI0032B436A0